MSQVLKQLTMGKSCDCRREKRRDDCLVNADKRQTADRNGWMIGLNMMLSQTLVVTVEECVWLRMVDLVLTKEMCKWPIYRPLLEAEQVESWKEDSKHCIAKALEGWRSCMGNGKIRYDKLCTLQQYV